MFFNYEIIGLFTFPYIVIKEFNYVSLFYIVIEFKQRRFFYGIFVK